MMTKTEFTSVMNLLSEDSIDIANKLREQIRWVSSQIKKIIFQLGNWPILFLLKLVLRCEKKAEIGWIQTVTIVIKLFSHIWQNKLVPFQLAKIPHRAS
jgi:hypothetical protein